MENEYSIKQLCVDRLAVPIVKRHQQQPRKINQQESDEHDYECLQQLDIAIGESSSLFVSLLKVFAASPDLHEYLCVGEAHDEKGQRQ